VVVNYNSRGIIYYQYNAYKIGHRAVLNLILSSFNLALLPSVQKEETSTNKGYEKPVKNH
jgi:hypothetical protein